MAKLKLPGTANISDEGSFKQQIQPAAWVNQYAAQKAKETYVEYFNAYRKFRLDNKGIPTDIVPYPVRLRGIEGLVTDLQLEGFWRKAKFDVIGSISGLYTEHFQSTGGSLRPITPKVSKSVRDKKLDNIAKHLERIFYEINSDPSVATCLEVAFFEALKAGSFKPENPCNIGAFFEKLHQSISTDGPDGCRRMKTHDALPRSMREGDKNERGRFMYGVSQIVFNSYQRSNHAVTAKILNIIRPDLGEFTADNVRQYMNKRPLSKWW